MIESPNSPLENAFTKACIRLIMRETTSIEDLKGKSVTGGWKYVTEEGLVVMMNEECDSNLIMMPGQWQISEQYFTEDGENKIEMELEGISEEDFIAFAEKLR